MPCLSPAGRTKIEYSQPTWVNGTRNLPVRVTKGRPDGKPTTDSDPHATVTPTETRFTAGSVAKLAAAHGFEIAAMRGMWLDPFYVSLVSERYRHGRTRLWPAVYRGAWSNLQAWGRPEKASSIIFSLKKAAAAGQAVRNRP